jgi:BTB/POZ domain
MANGSVATIACHDLHVDLSDDLRHDLQRLLSGTPALADLSAECGASRTLFALHTQLLSVRTPFFATALSHPWRAPSSPLPLPEVHPDSLADVLEYLYTGAVRLETSTGSAVRVAAAASYLLCPDLERTASAHILRNLTAESFSAHVRAAAALSAVPDRVIDALAAFVAANTAQILTSLASRDDDDDEIVRAVWALLARHLATRAPPPSGHGPQVEALLVWSSTQALRHSHLSTSNTPPAAAVPLGRILSATSPPDRAALIAVLSSAPSSLFVRQIEPLNLLTPCDLLEKYRADAFPPSVYNSPHPLPSPLPPKGPTCVRFHGGVAGVTIRIDRRTSLGPGVVLIFFAAPGRAPQKPLLTIDDDKVVDIWNSADVEAGVDLVIDPAARAPDSIVNVQLACPEIWFALTTRTAAIVPDPSLIAPDATRQWWGCSFSLEPIFSDETSAASVADLSPRRSKTLHCETGSDSDQD